MLLVQPPGAESERSGLTVPEAPRSSPPPLRGGGLFASRYLSTSEPAGAAAASEIDDPRKGGSPESGGMVQFAGAPLEGQQATTSYPSPRRHGRRSLLSMLAMPHHPGHTCGSHDDCPATPTGTPRSFQRPILALLISSSFSSLAMASSPSALAQMVPAVDRPGLSTLVSEPACLQGFRFQQTGNTYTCTSAAIKCSKPFTIPEAKIVDNRFIYSCTRIQ